MRPENSQNGPFAVGDSVQEVGSGLLGVIVRRGDFPGEWNVRLDSGDIVVCLESNLVRAGRQSPPTSP